MFYNTDHPRASGNMLPSPGLSNVMKIHENRFQGAISWLFICSKILMIVCQFVIRIGKENKHDSTKHHLTAMESVAVVKWICSLLIY